jgi:hypothetical protein
MLCNKIILTTRRTFMNFKTIITGLAIFTSTFTYAASVQVVCSDSSESHSKSASLLTAEVNKLIAGKRATISAPTISTATIKKFGGIGFETYMPVCVTVTITE